MRANQSGSVKNAAASTDGTDPSDVPSAAQTIIPFRESKLTHLFMNHLAGSAMGRTVMIVNVNPCPADYDETQHVLSYGAIAQTVKLAEPPKDKVPKAATHDANGRSLKSIAEESDETADAAKEKKEKVEKRAFKSRAPSAGGEAASGENSARLQQLEKENATLRTVLQSLQARLVSAEAEIRAEVAEEFEGLVADIHEQYAAQREAYESRVHGVPTPARSVRKIQVDQANEYVDELLEKIKECEEEMVRMREQFEIEKQEALHERDREIKKLKSEIARLKNGSTAEADVESDSEEAVEYQQNASAMLDEDLILATAEKQDGKSPSSLAYSTSEKEETVNNRDSMEEDAEEDATSSTTSGGSSDLSSCSDSSNCDDDSETSYKPSPLAPRVAPPAAAAMLPPPSPIVKEEGRQSSARGGKSKRLPRGRVSEVACAPIADESAAGVDGYEDGGADENMTAGCAAGLKETPTMKLEGTPTVKAEKKASTSTAKKIIDLTKSWMGGKRASDEGGAAANAGGPDAKRRRSPLSPIPAAALVNLGASQMMNMGGIIVMTKDGPIVQRPTGTPPKDAKGRPGAWDEKTAAWYFARGRGGAPAGKNGEKMTWETSTGSWIETVGVKAEIVKTEA